ncbi:hypothetical protein LQZ13_03995 [Leuconostoc mesenteroides]|uniref:hypothetical protein n=1 Tax=Leuconostoc mesenteroides TaxID=1245 RepID=UPI002113C39B|nr:hypothetical protein [Leuconostoc mesenteroides]UUE18599.1 hypothetical protein LQZ13_03995 [Leuconostoc mesenteroides]
MFNDIVSNIAIITSVSSTLAAIVGVVLGLANYSNANKQIKLSNKHFMYERRVSSYMFLSDLIALFKLEKEYLINEQKNDDPIFGAADIIFQTLTNTSRLSDLINEYTNPLKDVDEHKKYLTMIEKFKSQGQMFEFEFSGEIGVIANCFIQQYFDFLSQLMGYKILYEKIREYQGKQNNLPDCQREKQLDVLTTFGEKTHRKKLFDSFDKLDKTYSKMKEGNIVSELKKQIELIK